MLSYLVMFVACGLIAHHPRFNWYFSTGYKLLSVSGRVLEIAGDIQVNTEFVTRRVARMAHTWQDACEGATWVGFCPADDDTGNNQYVVETVRWGVIFIMTAILACMYRFKWARYGVPIVAIFAKWMSSTLSPGDP